MTDEVFTMVETNKERSQMKTGAAHRVNGSKSKNGGNFGVEYKTKKELNAMNGPVAEYNMKTFYNWQEFKAMPLDIQEEYITKLMNRYEIGCKTISINQFGKSKNALFNHLAEHGIGKNLPDRRKYPESKSGKSKYLSDLDAFRKYKEMIEIGADSKPVLGLVKTDTPGVFDKFFEEMPPTEKKETTLAKATKSVNENVVKTFAEIENVVNSAFEENGQTTATKTDRHDALDALASTPSKLLREHDIYDNKTNPINETITTPVILDEAAAPPETKGQLAYATFSMTGIDTRIFRLLTELYADEPDVKIVISVYGKGVSFNDKV